MKLYENIRDMRIEHGMTQDELATLAGYSNRSAIARIESGLVDLPHSKIKRFAEIFGIHSGDLMGWGEDDNGESFSPDEKSIIYRYRMLNRKGKKAATERLDELLVLPKFAEHLD